MVLKITFELNNRILPNNHGPLIFGRTQIQEDKGQCITWTKNINTNLKKKIEMCPQYTDTPAPTPSPAQEHGPGATVPYIKRS